MAAGSGLTHKARPETRLRNQKFRLDKQIASNKDPQWYAVQVSDTTMIP